MTRKDYELIAAIIWKKNFDGSLDDLAVSMANALKNTNPHFDFKRFVRACGVGVL
jgi:hypothetical protein